LASDDTLQSLPSASNDTLQSPTSASNGTLQGKHDVAQAPADALRNSSSGYGHQAPIYPVARDKVAVEGKLQHGK
jgi:hypothetical protein